MKTIFLLILLASSPALATTISVVLPTTAEQEARVLAKENADTCRSVGLPRNCTNAQARALDSSKTIYATVAAMVRGITMDYIERTRTKADAEDKAAFMAAVEPLSVAQKNVLCSGAGLPAGCLP